ncbi:MAG: oligosaccharide flippase family protein [Pseudobutyrivibrio sp.]|nr:oligosaccharide flippase family protein [Pseudobutyrivibrio sp.]
MILNRTQNAKRGLSQGWINNIIVILCAFITRTIMARTIGIEYLGLKSLFTSVFTLFNLAELGVGSALVFFMYKPIADNDNDLLCGYLNLYKKMYHLSGTFVIMLSIAIMPFIKIIIKGDLPDGVNVFVLFALFATGSICTYYFFAYSSSILLAHQRNDVILVIDSALTIIVSGLQVLALVKLKNIYLYVLIDILKIVIKNIIVHYIARSLFPEIRPRGKIPSNHIPEVKKKIYGVFVGKICGVSRNTFDSIFLSMFISIAVAGIYNNYYLIISSLAMIFNVTLPAIQAGIGNKIALESVDSNYTTMEIINFLYMFFASSCTAILLCLYQPFMKIWMGDKMMLSDDIVILLVLYFYIGRMGDIRYVYSEAAGLFYEDRIRSILEAIVNVVLNYILVRIMGVKGIVIATLISMFIFSTIGGLLVTFKHYFKKGIYKHIIRQGIYFIGTVLVCTISFVVSKHDFSSNIYFDFIIKAGITIIVTPIMLLGLYFKMDIAREVRVWIGNHFSFFSKKSL